MTSLAEQVKKTTSGKVSARLRATLRPLAASPTETPILSRILAEATPASALLADIAACSPYLLDLCLADLQRLERSLAADPVASLDEAIARARRACIEASGQADIMQALRRLKQSAALTIALADLGNVWSVADVTKALSKVADAAIAEAARWLLREAARQGRISPGDPLRPDIGSGLIILAMGKHGAFELNYSSDVDLIVLYDPGKLVVRMGEPASFFVKLTQGLVRLLSERTSDGYVFRIDLRLRPDPGATAIAISVPAALDYYESLGQNWERAAFIKARPCAGDVEAGAGFLRSISPFIWRRHLDYAAIADIHAMKRQINAHRGYEAIEIAGHDVKLGRGGIREIEFFVQTQQLIAGGRNPSLRCSGTVQALDALSEAGWIENQTRDDLSQAYQFLRRVEHRLQMVADEQTHTLPRSAQALKGQARLADFKSTESFSAHLRRQLECVQRHYGRLFESSLQLSNEEGSLVFTGKTSDPETLATLARLGFAAPEAAAETIRGWHFGRYAAMRSARAREDLTEVTPALLSALAKAGRPDAALIAFDQMLARMPSGFQLFSILRNNLGLLHVLAQILGVAPRLSNMIAVYPHALDGLLDPADKKTIEKTDVLERLRLAFSLAHGHEECLDRARSVARELLFSVSAKLVSEDLDPIVAGESFSAIAEASVQALLDLVDGELAKVHGRPAGARIAVVAMGKLGGREMTAASDLDLVLLYDHDIDRPETNGSRPVSPAVWFNRLTQRLIAALSAPMAQGILFPVDMRLRPSGHKGPVAVRLDAFSNYHAQEAWTWEHMALTRARPIAGDLGLGIEVSRVIHAILCRRRDHEKVRRDVVEMREILAREKPAMGIWDLKLAPGGLVDIEFIVQFLQLVHAADKPECLADNTRIALQHLSREGILPASRCRPLEDAWRFYSILAQVSHVCLETGQDAADAPEKFQSLLAKHAGEPNYSALKKKLAATQRCVHEIFLELTA